MLYCHLWSRNTIQRQYVTHVFTTHLKLFYFTFDFPLNMLIQCKPKFLDLFKCAHTHTHMHTLSWHCWFCGKMRQSILLAHSLLLRDLCSNKYKSQQKTKYLHWEFRCNKYLAKECMFYLVRVRLWTIFF